MMVMMEETMTKLRKLVKFRQIISLFLGQIKLNTENNNKKKND